MRCAERRLLSSIFSIFLLISSAQTHDDDDDDFLLCLQAKSNNYDNQGGIYTSRNDTYWSILQSSVQNLLHAPTQNTSVLKPKAILTPSHKSQIQAAIHCSKMLGLQIRIRSGGHDYEGLSYTSQVPFVIVDLRNFRSISIQTNNRTAWVGAGATLGEFYHAIARRSRTLAFVAGACPTVGVGGHFSGGGFSMMSRKFGLAADNIVDAKLIDVHGRILDRKTMGKNLFWAIRGGGGASFGIITAFKVRLLTVPENVTVFNVTRTLEQNATKLVHRWQYIGHRIDRRLLIRVFIRSGSTTSSTSGNRTVQVSFTSMFIGGANDVLAIMEQSFPELGLVKEDCVEMSWIESTLYFAAINPRSQSIDVLLNRTRLGFYFKGKSDYVMRPIPEKGLRGIWKTLQEDDDEGTLHQLQLTPYGGKMAEITESEIPFPHRKGNIYMIHYAVGWIQENSRQAERHIRWIRKLYRYMGRHVSDSPRSAYMNYRDLDLGVNSAGNESTIYRKARKWGRKYLRNNFDRLVRVKSKTDPSNFFRHEQSIPSLPSPIQGR